MAISDTIQSMYENVGEVYDTIKNVSLPEHKNIENIPSTIRDSYLEIMNNGIDVVWDNWEKVVGEGTDLTLSNTEQAPMKVLLKGNTYQDSTSISGGDAYDSPTPDHPQEVHTVSGDNEVIVSNGDNTQSTTYPINLPVENLLSLTDTNSTTWYGLTYSISNGEITINGTSTTAGRLSIPLANSISIENGVYYTLSKNYTGTASNSGFNVQIRGSSGNIVNPTFAQIPYTLNNASGTATELGLYIANNTTFTDFKLKLQLEKGTKQNSFTPYGTTPLWLGSIGDYKDRFFKTSGKNLFSGWTKGKSISSVNGSIVDNTDGAISDYIPVNFTTNQNYYVSGLTDKLHSFIGAYNSNKQFLGRTGASARLGTSLSSSSFSSGTPQGTGDIAYIIVCQYVLSGVSTGTINDVDNLQTQVEVGNTPTSYEPYGTDWYLKKEIGKVVLDGTETGWQVNDTGTAQWSYRWTKYNDQITAGYGLSNRYVYTAIGNTNTNQGFQILNASANVQIRIRYGTEDTIQNFKSWLGTNNVEVYYVLATPTYTKIEGTLASQLEAVYRAKSEEGQTNISQTNNDLPFVLDVSALSKE